jgi:hypothetical protein
MLLAFGTRCKCNLNTAARFRPINRRYVPTLGLDAVETVCQCVAFITFAGVCFRSISRAVCTHTMCVAHNIMTAQKTGWRDYEFAAIRGEGVIIGASLNKEPLNNLSDKLPAAAEL